MKSQNMAMYRNIIKHFNPKKKLVLSGVSALFTCCGAPPTSFFLGLTMFRTWTFSHVVFWCIIPPIPMMKILSSCKHDKMLDEEPIRLHNYISKTWIVQFLRNFRSFGVHCEVFPLQEPKPFPSVQMRPSFSNAPQRFLRWGVTDR